MTLDQTTDASIARICSVVSRLLARRAIPTLVARNADLRELGLTSLDMVHLILAIEGEFDLFIPERDMTPENFRTVLTIQSLVSSLRQAEIPSDRTSGASSAELHPAS